MSSSFRYVRYYHTNLLPKVYITAIRTGVKLLSWAKKNGIAAFSQKNKRPASRLLQVVKVLNNPPLAKQYQTFLYLSI
jgi:hypothetical protein|tara:strand:+ start:11635 stop:11868 length:234 start_codon:yes stop_codon:yes gene_type:complete